MWKSARLALVAVGGIAVVILAQLGVAGANADGNPAGVSCTATPGDPGFNEIISFDFSDFAGTVVLRENTGPGSSDYLVTLSPNSEVSTATNPLGYFIRYRIAGEVFDVPCSSVSDPNPADVSCTVMPSDPGINEIITFDLNGFDDSMFLRGNTGPGTSDYLVTLSPTSEVSSSINPLGYFVRYRIAGEVFDIPCDEIDDPNPLDITCEYLTRGNDQISLTVTGAPDDLSVFIRALTADGSRYVTQRLPNVGTNIPDNADYIARYRVDGQVVDVPCLQVP